jgi:RND family efflux transporter MFP subunit
MAAAAAVCLFAGCPVGEPPPGQSGEGRQAARASVIRPERKLLVRTVELPGRVEAVESTPLFAKVTGYVEKITVDIGDEVSGPDGDKAATVLCELLVPELKEELAESTAAVQQSEAEVGQADAAVKLAEASVRAEEALVREAQAAVARADALFARWESQYQRVSELAQSGAVTSKVAEETQAEFKAADAGRKEAAARVASAEAKLEEAIAGREKSKADASAARARLGVTEAARRRVATMMDYSVIRAPYAGIVVERNVHTGHLVEAGGGNNRAPLFTVMRMNPVRVFVDVPEADAVLVAKGCKARLRIPSLPADPIEHEVTRTSWSLNEASRTLTAEIEVPNPGGKWRPGVYAQVTLTVAELPDALCLPRTAIVVQDKDHYCLVVGTDGKVVRQAVSLGISAGSDVEIRSGLTGEEQVIGVNPGAFREGQVVEIAPPTS